MDVNGQLYTPTALLPKNIPPPFPVTNKRRLGWLQSWLEHSVEHYVEHSVEHSVEKANLLLLTKITPVSSVSTRNPQLSTAAHK
jgi:hypothetical protein